MTTVSVKGEFISSCFKALVTRAWPQWLEWKQKNKKTMFAKIPLDLKNLFASNIGHKERFAHMFPIWMFFKTIRTWLNSNRHIYRSRHIAFKAIWGTAKCTATLAVHFKKHQIYRKIRFRHADQAKKTSNSIVQLLKELCLDFNEFFSQNQIFSEMDIWFKFLTLCNLPCLKTVFIFDYS